MSKAAAPGAAQESAATETSEFDKAFEEFAGAADKAAAPEPETEDEEQGEPAAAAEPAPAAAKEPAPAAAAKPAPAADWKPLAVTDAVWANATDEQKRAYQEVAQRVRSDDGRQRAYTNTIAAKDSQITRLTADLEALRKPATAAAPKQDPADAPAAVLSSDDWKKLKEDYPEIAGPISKMMGSILKENERLNAATETMSQQLNKVAATQGSDVLDKNDVALTGLVPEWTEIRETQEWIDWLNAQPKYVIEAARRNGNGITDVDEAADIFRKFMLETGMAATAPPATAASRTPPANGSAAPAQTPTTDARRQRQLNASRTVSTKGPAPATGAPEEFGDAFEFYVQKQEQERRAGTNR